jgi:hypothetical protein
MYRVARAFLLSIALIGTGCSRARPSTSYEVVVRVTSEAADPVGGAKIMLRDAVIGTTRETGLAKLLMQGREGDVVPLSIACPHGFRSPAKSLDVPLRHLAEPGKPPEFSASCTPLKRSVVVAVRADNGPNLPVVYLGEEVARTDASGAAHVLLNLTPGDEFELSLDTSDASAFRLRPQKPSARFTAKGDDEILTFNVAFKVEPEKHGPHARKSPDMPIHF